MIDSKCDIILPVCDQLDYAENCIESIVKSTTIPYRIIVVNNGKDEGIKIFLSKMKDTLGDKLFIIQNDENIGWVRALNQGIAASVAPYVVFQNDDTIVTPNWLKTMISIMEENPKIGLINPSWEIPEKTSVEDFAKKIQKFGTDYIETDWCRGFSILIRREIIDKIGGPDFTYVPFYYDDWDISIRAIEAGYLCVKAKGVFVHHYRNVTAENVLKKERMKKIMERNGKIFYKRWSKPFKVIFLVKGSTDILGDGLKKLCRMQNRLRCFVTSKGSYKHTTLTEKTLPSFSASFLVLLSVMFRKKEKLLDDYAGIFTNDKLSFSLLKPLLKDRIYVGFEEDAKVLTERAIDEVKKKKEEYKLHVKV